MTALPPLSPDDFSREVLHVERAAQLFPALGISIIESRRTPDLGLGSNFGGWTGRPDTFLALAGEVGIDVTTGDVEVHVTRAATLESREVMYRTALGAATNLMGDREKTFTAPRREPDGRVMRWSQRWCRVDDPQMAEALVDELQPYLNREVTL